MRIVSLIPSATELIYALGYEKYLVGRSHACDFPVTVMALPICTAPQFDPQGSSQEIHDRVTALITAALSVYEVNLDQLTALAPTHIITQAQCEVCAVSLAAVEKAVSELIPAQPQIISLQPRLLADLWDDMKRLAIALDAEQGEVRANLTIQQLQRRLQDCLERIPTRLPQPTVACLEWTAPLMAAGNWIPELVTLAGGHPLFAQGGQHSPWLSWDALLAADPDLIVAMPCGYDLAQTRQAIQLLERQSYWQQLQAVQQHRVYLVEANQYFNRPGPRLIDSLEILAEILHPDACAYGYAMQAWKLY